MTARHLGRVARPLADLSRPATALLLELECHACGHPGLVERSHAAGGTRHTWTGRCPECRTETVVVADVVTLHRDKEYEP